MPLSKQEQKNLKLKRIFLLQESSCRAWVSGEEDGKAGWLLCTCDSSPWLHGKPSSRTEPFTPAHLHTAQKEEPGQATQAGHRIPTGRKRHSSIIHPILPPLPDSPESLMGRSCNGVCGVSYSSPGHTHCRSTVQ